jgi:hypothetical protein
MNTAPVITRLQAIPVAGRDGMLMNLSGAHGPFFTRNLVILTDSSSSPTAMPAGAARKPSICAPRSTR